MLLLCTFFANSLAVAQVSTQSAAEKSALRTVAEIQAGNQEPDVIYRAAFQFALANKTEEAFKYLEMAIQRGYVNVEHIKSDPDLNSLHSDARWQQMIAKAEAKRKEQEAFFWNKKEFWESPALKTPFKENLSEDEKVAGLSKFWSEAKYNFVNFDLVPELDWDALYLSYLPRIKNTKSTLEYYMLLREMCAKLRDGHTNVYVPKELQDELSARPLMRTRLIEDKVIVVGVYDDVLKQNGLEVGQEILEIDNVPVTQYAEQRIKPYISASTGQDLESRMYDAALPGGAINKPLELTLRDVRGSVFKKSLQRIGWDERVKRFPQPDSFTFKILPGNIAYVALNEFGSDRAAKEFEAAFNEIGKSKALIIDVRENGGGSSGIGYRVLSMLTDKAFKTSSWYTRQYRPTYRAWERPQNVYGSEAGEISPHGKNLYTKPVIVLTSPRTFSAAEDFAVAYLQMKRGLIMGEPTGGSTGQPLFISLPGGGSARICTKRDRFADGREFVGVGVQPDKIVKQTVADFRKGRDTVLDAALKEIDETMKLSK
jgi:C-terminal processing protease CtpA/Prc